MEKNQEQEGLIRRLWNWMKETSDGTDGRVYSTLEG